MNAITNPERLKKVMRIALVGIRPADQVMLKGYLRILLRLEADLEWVSANHPDIDLFMINNEFRNAESVQRLLASQNSATTLFVGRNDSGDGHLVGNLLTLPLKELDELKQWFKENVAFLANMNTKNPPTHHPHTAQTPVTSVNSANNPTTNTAPQSQSSANNAQSRQTLDEILARRQSQPNVSQNIASASQSANVVSQPTISNTTPNATANKLLNVAKLFAQLQRREDKLLSLMDGQGTLIAYIQPKQQRVWQMADKVVFDMGWKLTTESFSVNTEPRDAQDLVQWLWQIAMQNANALEGLVDRQTAYRLTSWIKPDNGTAQHNQLKIQATIEKQALPLANIAQHADVTLAEAGHTVIGLLVAGLMPTSIYDALIKRLTDTPTVTNPLSQTNLTGDNGINSATSTTMSNANQSAPLSQASSNVTSTPASNSAMPTNTTQPTAESDDGMKGFLSRLRRKLGI